MVVGRLGCLLSQSELPICLEPANQDAKSMAPARRTEEDCGWELEGSPEAGRATDSTDDEETSSTESAQPPAEECVGSPVQRRLEVERMKATAHISKLEQRIRELQLHRRELDIEVEMELALLEGELSTERKEMDREEELIRALHGCLGEAERRWQDERDKDKLRLQEEKRKVQNLERTISERRAQLDKQPESLREQLRKEIQEMMETMDGAGKSFEDLEFQQLERESGREEEREAAYRRVSQDTARHQNELNRRKDKVVRLEQQVRWAEEQAQAERGRLSEENTRIFQALNKEKDRLLTLSALCGKDPGQHGMQDVTPRKGLQRTSSLPRRRSNAQFVRPTDRPVSLHGSGCLEGTGLALHLAVSSSSAGGQIALAVSPNLQISRIHHARGEERTGSYGGKTQNGPARLPLSSLPKIAEMERQLREAMAEKERLLKAREEKRAAKEMTRRLETDQNQLKEEASITTPALVQPVLPPETAVEPVKVPSLPPSPAPFDLRAYLEASGHSVDTCSQVRVSAMCCRGYLVKMGGRIKTWKKRWFVFDRQKRRLAYYSDKEEQKLKGVIYFQAIEEVYYDHLRSAFKSPHHKLTFCLKTFERLFCMVAPTPEAMRIWMDVMVTAAEENARY